MSVEALGATLAGITEQIRDGYRVLHVAQQRLAEASARLAELSEHHSESLIPPQLALANDALTVSMTQLAGCMAATERLAAGL
ncbi:MAG TPA: hypothetical protein VGN81_29115 [Pseudonocardiaceae bacterium]|jgi:hypothetical protein